jgi:hypothetical protein
MMSTSCCKIILAPHLHHWCLLLIHGRAPAVDLEKAPTPHDLMHRKVDLVESPTRGDHETDWKNKAIRTVDLEWEVNKAKGNYSPEVRRGPSPASGGARAGGVRADGGTQVVSWWRHDAYGSSGGERQRMLQDKAGRMVRCWVGLYWNGPIGKVYLFNHQLIHVWYIFRMYFYPIHMHVRTCLKTIINEIYVYKMKVHIHIQ